MSALAISYSPKTFLRFFWILLGSSVAVYCLAVYLMRTQLCEPIGGWVAVAAVIIGAGAALVSATQAVLRKSVGWGVGLLGVVLLTAIMYLSVGVFMLPGCSGV
jgi:RsiW-degrading membrane proteinase PrsW (M82 family)